MRRITYKTYPDRNKKRIKMIVRAYTILNRDDLVVFEKVNFIQKRPVKGIVIIKEVTN
jgi:hypothetical protein